MNKLTMVLMLVLLSGCESTTSGLPKVTPDKEDAAEYNYQLGARYYRNGSYELARDRLRQSLEFDSRRAITWYTLALTYEALENPRLDRDAYQAAMDAYQKAEDARARGLRAQAVAVRALVTGQEEPLRPGEALDGGALVLRRFRGLISMRDHALARIGRFASLAADLDRERCDF